MMQKENHIINNPLLLLSFFKEMTKEGSDLMKIEEEEIKFDFRIEKFVDSVTVIGGYWLNTIELMKMLSLLELYDLSDIIDIKFGYIAGMRREPDGEQMVDNRYYDTHITLSKVEIVELPNQLSLN